LGRNEATARGCTFVVREAAKAVGLDIKGATVAVQGYGNAGSIVANLLHKMGCKVVAVVDSTGGAYNPQGFIPEKLEVFKSEIGTVKGYPGSKNISSEELLTMSCDILIPAALENQITEEIKIIGEAANGPTTPGADRILTKNGVLVLPDILANAGGVTVSYFEWVQNNMGYYWSEEEVNSKLEGKMVDAFNEVYKMFKGHKHVDMRTAAYMVSISYVSEAMAVRGWLGEDTKVQKDRKVS